MSDLVGNPEDRFSRVAAHLIQCKSTDKSGQNLDVTDQTSHTTRRDA